MLASVAIIVLANTLLDAMAGYYLIRYDFDTFRVWLAISMGLTAVINMILVILMWIVFETLTRVERESDRMQSFMDNMYRRSP